MSLIGTKPLSDQKQILGTLDAFKATLGDRARNLGQGLNTYVNDNIDVLSETWGVKDGISYVRNGYDNYVSQIYEYEKKLKNPFAFLLEILKSLGVTDEEIIKWLVNLIKYELPLIELGIKGILLSNMKSLISCAIDPRIPKWMREEGVSIPIFQVDPTYKLRISPFTEEGSLLYFGNNTSKWIEPHLLEGKCLNCGENVRFKFKKTNENESKHFVCPKCGNEDRSKMEMNADKVKLNKLYTPTIYSFLRGKDFDGFLWTVMHKPMHPQPSELCNESDYENGVINKYKSLCDNVSFVNLSSSKKPLSIFETTEIQFEKSKTNCPIIVGNTYCQSTAYGKLQSMLLCETTTIKLNLDFNKSKNVTTSTTSVARLVPIGNDIKRTTYYVNRPTYFNFLNSEKLDRTNPRDFSKDTPLFSLSYENDVINLRVLPKPYIHIPRLGQTMLLPKRILFNTKGKPDSDGRFTLDLIKDCQNNLKEVGLALGQDIGAKVKEQFNKNKYEENPEEPVEIGDYDLLWWYQINNSPYWVVFDASGKYWISEGIGDKPLFKDDLPPIEDPEIILPLLVETYKGLTIYEFNYDYLMSMQLFDPKVVAVQLVNALLGFELDYSVGLSVTQIEEQNKLVEIVKQLIEGNDYESSDCFFSFSNDKYNQMSQNADLKYSNLSQIGDNLTDSESISNGLASILEEFGDAATLEESVSTFSNLVQKVSANTTQEAVEGEDKVNPTFNIVIDFVKELSTILIKSLVSPKLLLFLAVNNQMVGQQENSDSLSIDTKALLRTMTNVVVQIVREIRDMILKELFEFDIERIKYLLKLFLQELTLEQTKFYRDQLKDLLRLFALIKKYGHQTRINTELDKVDYADIDDITPTEPKTSKC